MRIRAFKGILGDLRGSSEGIAVSQVSSESQESFRAFQEVPERFYRASETLQ